MLTIITNAIRKASNDDHISRSRTVPIPETLTTVPGYPSKLTVYKIAASKYWQMRCWTSGKTHKRSTKTTSLRKAQSVARQFYEYLVAQHYQAQHTPVFSSSSGKVELTQVSKTVKTFATVAAQMYANEQARVDRGEFSRDSLLVLRNRLDAHILPQFGKTPINGIKYQNLLEFTQHLSKRYSTVTVSQYLVAVRKVLKLADQLGYIESQPELPKVKIVTKPRGGFTPSEYWQILRTARRLINQPHPETTRQLRTNYKIRSGDTHMPPDLAWAIGFMVNAFLRPSDLHKLKHKHVEVVRTVSTCYLRLTLPETKLHDAPVVTLAPAVRIYSQITKYQAPKNLANPESYLFLPHLRDRNYAMVLLSTFFNWVLNETGLKQNTNGSPRSLYSLRHSAITFRLLYGSGIDLLTLARNARTSIEIINKHYASTVTGEQNIAMLQSRRKRMP